jgi:23S rRNA pseudouridine2605 synthase
MAAAGVGPRRHCEELIIAGQVAVNGHIVDTFPVFVDPKKDRITVAGRPVRTTRPVYVMLFKPRGVVCTNADPDGRRRAIDLVDHPSRARLFAVGRLDLDSSGLLLLTNDGELSNRLVHPRYELPKVYEISVKGSMDADEIRKLERGMFVPATGKGGSRGRGARTKRTRLRLLKRDRDRTRLLIELTEGRNRQVRRMLQRVGHPVRRLRRVRIGPLKLAGLRPGQWRDLTPQEVAALKRAASRVSRPRGSRPRADRRSAPGGSRRAGPPGK